jgi:hypothetical protein
MHELVVMDLDAAAITYDVVWDSGDPISSLKFGHSTSFTPRWYKLERC